MNPLSQLAKFNAHAIPPDDVCAKTALILADSIGAIVGGAAEPEVDALRRRMAQGSVGRAALIGTSLCTAPGVAALLNGTAGTTLEMDEGNQFCKGHPGMHVIPAALAEASALNALGRDVSGRELLTAIALGYEAAARVGIATALRPSMHPHGTWGAIGAVTAVLRLRETGADQIREGMNIAASLGLTTSRRTMLEGGTVRNVFAGISNQMGILAADLVGSGYCGDHDGVGHVFGKVASETFNADELSIDLGTRWEVMRNYFKMHACCRYNHATLDALTEICRQEPGLAQNQVQSILVETYSLAVELDDPAPRNVLAAKFSVPFAVATVLIQKSSDAQSFTIDKVQDTETLALAERVQVREDPAMTAQLPHKRPARVIIKLTDGRTLSAETQSNRGDWADPYPVDELYTKYQSLTARLWTKNHAGLAWEVICALPKASSTKDLFNVISG